MLLLFLQQVGKEVPISEGNVVTALLGLTTTIFAALTLTQKSQVDGLKQIIADCRSGRDEDIKYERVARQAAESKEDKCLDRLSSNLITVADLTTAVREGATVSSAIVSDMRNYANSIVRNQDAVSRDIADNKKVLDEIKRTIEDLRYKRAGTN